MSQYYDVIMYYYIFIEILVCNRCMSSILLVYTTSVHIDQRFIVSDVSTPHLVHNICMSDMSDYCILLNFANICLKFIYFVFLPRYHFSYFK